MRGTIGKKRALERELEAKQLQLEQVRIDKAEAAADGDLKENVSYEIAKQNEETLEQEISKIRSDLNNYEVIETNNSEYISIGDRVEVSRVCDDKSIERIGSFLIDSSGTTKDGILSTRSPLGKRILDNPSGRYTVQARGSFTYVVQKVMSEEGV